MINDLLVYVPISVFGIWRWSYWLVRVIGAQFYRLRVSEWPIFSPKPKISIVTPVYNEDEGLFRQAVESWIANGVDEIIALIDRSNTRLIAEFERRYSGLRGTKCHMIVTKKNGKRAALCDGISKAKGDLIALVDSDTVWDSLVAKKSIAHFTDPSVGGVTVTQRVMEPRSLSNVLFDILLWTRYREEVPFLLGLGRAFNTLSGRTAIYRRTALVNDLHDNIYNLRHEFFAGSRSVSGDDKRLTHLILEQGWNVSLVLGAFVYTRGTNKLGEFMKQRLRWTRNSWRADLRAVSRGWVFRHPVLAVFMIDRFVQPFFMLIGPAVLVIAISSQQWLAVAILLGWWLVSRFIRLFSYFRRYPKRLIYLPAYIVYTYINALVKIYALGTVFEHNWATRWHKSRQSAKKFILRYTSPVAGIATIVIFLAGVYIFVNKIATESAVTIAAPPPVDEQDLKKVIGSTLSPNSPQLPPGATLPSGVLRYTVQPGDTLDKLSKQLGLPIKEIKRSNNIPDPDKITEGQVILYYLSPPTQ